MTQEVTINNNPDLRGVSAFFRCAENVLNVYRNLGVDLDFQFRGEVKKEGGSLERYKTDGTLQDIYTAYDFGNVAKSECSLSVHTPLCLKTKPKDDPQVIAEVETLAYKFTPEHVDKMNKFAFNYNVISEFQPVGYHHVLNGHNFICVHEGYTNTELYPHDWSLAVLSNRLESKYGVRQGLNILLVKPDGSDKKKITFKDVRGIIDLIKGDGVSVFLTQEGTLALRFTVTVKGENRVFINKEGVKGFYITDIKLW